MGGMYPSQITTTPFLYDKYGRRFNMELYSGFCGVYKDKTTKAFSPCVG